MKRARIEEREAAEKAKQEEVKAAAEAKKTADLAYKASVKAFIELCQETLVGSNFDRFWVEGQQRTKLNTKDKVEAVSEKL